MGLVKRKNQDEIAEIDIDTIMDVNFLFRIGHNTDLEASSIKINTPSVEISRVFTSISLSNI